MNKELAEQIVREKMEWWENVPFDSFDNCWVSFRVMLDKRRRYAGTIPIYISGGFQALSAEDKKNVRQMAEENLINQLVNDKELE